MVVNLTYPPKSELPMHIGGNADTAAEKYQPVVIGGQATPSVVRIQGARTPSAHKHFLYSNQLYNNILLAGELLVAVVLDTHLGMFTFHYNVRSKDKLSSPLFIFT